MPVSDKQFSSRFAPNPWWLLLPALLFMMWAGGRGLNMDYLFFDGELKSVGHAGLLTGPYAPQQILNSVSTISPQHGPLYFVLLAGWANFVGTNQVALRLLSLFFSLLAMAFTYRLGTDLASPRVGLIAGTLLGISIFLIDFTHSIRMYTMIACTIAAELWLFHRMIRPNYQPKPIEYVLLGLNTGAVLLTHYLGGLVLGVIGLYHLLFVSKNRRWLLISGSFVAGGLIFLPWVPVLITGMETRRNLTNRALDAFGSFELILYLFGNGSILLVVGAALLAVYGLYRRERGAVTIVFYTVVGILVVLVANELSPLLQPERARYLLIIWPLLAIFVGLGLAQLCRWPLLITAVMGLWLLSGFATVQTDEFNTYTSVGGKEVDRYPPFTEMLHELRPRVHSDDLLITFTSLVSVTNSSDFDKSIANYYLDSLGVEMIMLATRDDLTLEQAHTRVDFYIPNHPAIWLAYEPSRLPLTLPTYRQILAEDYQSCGEVAADSVLVIEKWIPVEAQCEL